MSSEKETTLKRIIQSVPLDTPPAGFTEQVMQDVLADAADEVAISPALRPMLQRLTLDNPPAGFDIRVMQQVQRTGKSYKPEPLLSVNDWLRFAFCAATFIVIAFLIAPDSITDSKFSQHVHRIVVLLGMTKGLYALAFICTTVLLMIDQVLRRRLLRG